MTRRDRLTQSPRSPREFHGRRRAVPSNDSRSSSQTNLNQNVGCVKSHVSRTFVPDERFNRFADVPSLSCPAALRRIRRRKPWGQRIRQLLGERQLTAERLAFESELGSKGFLSDIEQGRARPSIGTLQVIADDLEVTLLDLFTFPDESERAQLVDRTRWLTRGAIRKLLRDMPSGPPKHGTASTAPAPAGSPGPAKSRYVTTPRDAEDVRRGGVDPRARERPRAGHVHKTSSS
jgi:transcriptional regulator with XRE-family HTH domain